MRVDFSTRAHIWRFTVCVTLFSVFASEVLLVSVHLLFGASAFVPSTIYFVAAVIAILVSTPVTYVLAMQGHQLAQVQQDLMRLAETDSLTGLTNRRSFFSHSTDVLAAAKLDGKPVTLMVLDADYFKQLNDTYGHAVGDAGLKFISESLQQCVRSTDVTCRLGGEEFAILLPGMDAITATPLAKRIVDTISAKPMVTDNRIIEMSVSCGYADTGVAYDMTQLFKAADDALYAAKADGRNCAVVHGPAKVA